MTPKRNLQVGKATKKKKKYLCIAVEEGERGAGINGCGDKSIVLEKNLYATNR
jgi:hypothetical protein